MREEILKVKGRIGDYRTQIKHIDLEAKGLVLIIRNYIDPFEVLANIRHEEALESMTRFHFLLEQRKEIMARLAELEEVVR